MTKAGESSEVGVSQETLSDAAPPRREVERGSTFGRYVVIEPIGRGGMSVVYAAYDPELDRKVALKVLRTSTDRPDALARERARLLREAQAMARLSHPNVVTVYDAGSIGDQVFLAMHLVDGKTMGQWLAQPREWSEIVEYFVYAGRGLAAAHDAGLVHRDFKPDNVLIDRDGRVRVTDFGLARPSGNTEREGLQATPITASGRLDRPVTLAGAILGTPAYMAPEQHLALPVDARGDQFSFCVALWEALTGERPFAGGTVGELAFAVTRGEMRSFPRESKVPPRVRIALARGLARDPQQRFASMHELIAALMPPRRRRPVMMLLGAVGLVGVGAVAMGLGRQDEAVDPCVSAGAAIDGVWNDDRRGELERHLSGRGIDVAASRRALDQVGAFAHDWREFSKAACVAYRDGAESDAAFDARSRCLSRRLADLERRTDRLATATAENAGDAVIGTYDIIGAQECNDTERLLAQRPLPDDPAQREAALALEADINALQTHWVTPDGIARARALLARAEQVGWPGAIADIELFLARDLIDNGRNDEAEQLLERAAQHAGIARDDDVRLVAWTELAYVLGAMQTRIPEALRVASVVESELARLGDNIHAPAHLIMLGTVYQSAGELARAREAYGTALRMLDDRPGSQSARRAVLLNNRGTVTLQEGDALAARVDFEAALGIAREIYGDGHPRLSDNYVNICESYLLRGELVEGEASCRRALELVDQPTVFDAPALARALHAVAVLELHLHGPARARTLASRAAERLRATFGQGSYADAAAEELSALVALYDEDAEGARRHATRANDLLVSMGPAFAESRLRPLWILGVVAFQQGDHAAALALCDDALATLSAEADPLTVGRLEPLACRGAALLALDRRDEAITPLEQAIAVHAMHGGDPLAIAHAEYSLAEAIVGRDPARARALATSARQHAGVVIERVPRFAAMVDAWLEAHP